jgi:uncharacterized SAM-binding protein YcdF (DUF218 family)
MDAAAGEIGARAGAAFHDAVVILGAALAGPWNPSPGLVRRVEFGARIFHESNAAVLVVSGGVVEAPPAEAEVMAELARARGVPNDRILLEPRSRNTFENAVHCGAILHARGWRSMLVVTEGFHLARALFVFRALGLPVAGAGVPRPADVSRLHWLAQHAQERVRLVRSALLFRMGAHKPFVEAAWGRYGSQP